MKIHNVAQKSDEWKALRAECFTASNLGSWLLEPVKVTLTVKEIEAKLDALGIVRKGITKRDDLLAILPNPEQYAVLCEGARTAIISQLKQERLAKLRKRDPDSLAIEEQIYLRRENEIQEKSDKAFEYNIPVKYGNELEPYARSRYESMTGYEVAEVGFCTASFDGLGCSPDGLIYSGRPIEHAGNVEVIDFTLSHGLELKCPIPETHLAWLDDGVLPSVHEIQVHVSMICCEVDTWHFLSYCPGEIEFLITVKRDEFTDKLERGLKILIAEKAKLKAKFSAMWGKVKP